LQKFIAILGEEIKFSELEKIISSSENNLVMDFIFAMAEEDSEKVSKIYLDFLKKDFDVEIFASEILEKIRIILLIKNSQEFEKFYSEKFSKEEIENFKKIEGLNSGHLKKFLEILDLIKKSEKKKAAFEILLHDTLNNCDEKR
jgi:DNA polymerase III gamma/tau subunit